MAKMFGQKVSDGTPKMVAVDDSGHSQIDVLSLSDTAANDFAHIHALLEELNPPAATPITGHCDAQNEYTDPLTCAAGHYACIDITGISGDTVTLQKRYNAGSWVDVETFTADVSNHAVPILHKLCEIRAGIKTGEYSAGEVDIVLYQG